MPRKALPILQQGSRDPLVRWAQLLLNQHGANLPLQPKSVFGPETHAAVLSFQRSQRLRADGVIGMNTWAKLVDTKPPEQSSGRRSAYLQPVADSSSPSAMASVADWPLTLRFEKVLQRVPRYLSPELAVQFRAMLTPTNLGIAVGSLAAWAVSHAFGAGEIIDVLLLAVGAAFVGLGIFQAGRDLADCLMLTLHAKDPADLEKAADALAQAVVILGITAFFALLAKVAARFARAGAGAGERAAAGAGTGAEGAAPKPSAVEAKAAAAGSAAGESAASVDAAPRPSAAKPPSPKLAEEPAAATKEPPPPPPADPMKLAAALRDAPNGSAERAGLADEFAKISTHVKEPANRVVLGKWSEGGGYVAEAQKNGGVWYETPEGTYQVMGKQAAWETNEAFLKQQMATGKPVEFTGMSEDEVAAKLADLNAGGQPIESAPARIREFVFMQNNAPNYGYVQQGMSFVKAP